MVLSNYKMHTDSNTEFQNLIPVIISNVSSNRIKIQEILLILQLETGYFSKLFISESAPFEAVGIPELLFYTKKSYRILQATAPIPAPTTTPILQGYPSTHAAFTSTRVHTTLHIHPENSPSRNPILHAEDKELFEYYRFQKFYA